MELLLLARSIGAVLILSGTIGAVLILSGTIQKMESSVFVLVIVKSCLTMDLFVRHGVYRLYTTAQ
jgi:hypothetical protein